MLPKYVRYVGLTAAVLVATLLPRVTAAVLVVTLLSRAHGVAVLLYGLLITPIVGI